MAESKSDTSSNPSSGKNVKAPNVFDRMKEEFEAVLHNGKHEHKHHKHHEETHGLREDIDSNTKMADVKAPNVFERAKEEIEALVEAIHPKKEVPSTHDSSSECETRDSSMKGSEKSELHSERGKEETGSRTQKGKPHHHKETHGLSYDIDENTPISEVKGPSVFERAKEEIEALVQTIHPKKDSSASTHKKK